MGVTSVVNQIALINILALTLLVREKQQFIFSKPNYEIMVLLQRVHISFAFYSCVRFSGVHFSFYFQISRIDQKY